MSKSLIIVGRRPRRRAWKSFLVPASDRGVDGACARSTEDAPGCSRDHDFQPTYVQIPIARRRSRIRKAVQGADQVHWPLTPRPRGEAIAWHLLEALRLENPLRIEFNEITLRRCARRCSPRTLDGTA